MISRRDCTICAEIEDKIGKAQRRESAVGAESEEAWRGTLALHQGLDHVPRQRVGSAVEGAAGEH
jgi:hypothetical protein